jgi:GNAT superfamily N-acetyltransferase
MGARIRPITPADVPAVVRLVAAVLEEHGFAAQMGGVGGAGGVERDIGEASTRYGASGAGFWVAVAEDSGEVIGTVAVRPKEGRTCEIKRLYLRADRRGAGLGQALYAHAEAFARRCGYERIWLDSSRRFARAHRLYERNGFVLLERIDNAWEDNVYEKRLG